MLYSVLKRTIARGGYDVTVMQEKLDVFYAADRLTLAQYQELAALLTA
jgi:hypothetical protein